MNRQPLFLLLLVLPPHLFQRALGNPKVKAVGPNAGPQHRLPAFTVRKNRQPRQPPDCVLILETLLTANTERGSLTDALSLPSSLIGTALAHAASKEHLDAVRCLLRAGAAVEQQVFEMAQCKNHTGVLAVLNEARLEQAVPLTPFGVRPTNRL